MNFLSTALLAIAVTLSLPAKKGEQKLYDEIYRPQFHFTPEKNWHNDPNGLVFYDNEYHMFYQYNPNGNEWGYMHWGHTVSTDLIHWSPLPIALYPDEGSTDKEHCTAYSGSAIVDENNLLQKQTGDTKTLVAFYTSQHCGQRLAYSTDKGRTWEKYEDNPIIAYDENDDARDPKVIWHEESGKWVMALYRKSNDDDKSKGVSFYTSTNLIDWEWQSHITGFFECPDLVKFKVTNRPDETKWVLFDGDGSYFIGSFDGKKFTQETIKMKSDWGKNYYATQTWSNIPESDGRVIQIAWMRDGKFPDMPFNGQMSFPSELSVTKFDTGYKLIRKPISEIEQLHSKHQSWENKNVIPGINDNKLKKVSGDCLHIIGEFDLKTSDSFGFMLRHSNKSNGTEILYSVKRGTLTVLGSTVPLPAKNNKIKLEILLDRTSIEIYANDGQAVVSNCFTPNEKAVDAVLYTNGGELGIEKLDVYEMNSIWNKK
ncbi:glycoside hydrolase family 32 protein [Draconibacterium sp. IB214405]|uniref:glycoside hydrolase family 32 protein n=1 Tax=Draconibacterium sp. IB214405 TaxID=3097352 RepID=UPI002A0FE94C|nr:glycoside hydrolase family 32 protein [Draconibacterium sp. IB214405]MDX8341631.1 glycoside hydrolase family 32 protein [Draconibacterium sp. IB214405]